MTSAPVWEGHNIYFGTDDETDLDDVGGPQKKQTINTGMKVDIEDDDEVQVDPPLVNQ